MRTRHGQSSSDEDETETAPLIQNPGPPPHPRPPPPPLPRGQLPQALPRRPSATATLAAAVPRPPSPAPGPRQHQQQQQQQQQPRQQPRQQSRNIATSQPPLPPPEIPPPPPPPAVCPSDWILKIRHPGRGYLQIHVPKGMTAYLLSKCIIQATGFADDTVVGLFGYTNGLFVSLEHLLACSENSSDEVQALHNQLYSLYIPEPILQPPWWDDWRILGGGIFLVVAILYTQLPNVHYMISSIPLAVEKLFHKIMYYVPLFYHNLVTQPLKDTYRYGPTVFGGWEGVDLPTICARLTYGTEDFWQRNYKDCENMYLAKESAFLFVGRPLIFLVLVLIFVWIVRQWMWYEALKVRDRYQDRDMIQTYQAIQILFRQMNRMVRTNDHQQRGGRR